MVAMTVKLRRWGNSLAAIIPAEVAREAGLEEGDEVVLDVDKHANLRRAFGSMKHGVDAQRMKDEARKEW